MSQTITVELPAMPDFMPRETGDPASLVGTARFADCAILERRIVPGSGPPTLQYHRTGRTARVFCLSENASRIEAGAIGCATMTDEGYWELTSVYC